MDLQQLEQQWFEIEQRYKEWSIPLRRLKEEFWNLKERRDGDYEAFEQEYRQLYKQLCVTYNPSQADFPIREAMLEYYAIATPEERAQIRLIVCRHRYVAGVLLGYILQCAECLESPEDGWILRSGLIAAAIENYAGWGDFRDTDHVLAKLGEAAIKARIDIEPIAVEVASMCSPQMPGYMSTRFRIEDFTRFALHAAGYYQYDE